MRSFLTDRRLLSAVVLSLAATTLAALFRNRTHETPPPKNEAALNSLAFNSVSAPNGTRGVLKIHRELGLEFRVSSFGREQAAVGCDRETYWFWMKSYDPRSHYSCPATDIDKVGLNPLFSPFFIRCLSGAEFLWRGHPEYGDLSISEDGCSLTISFRAGRMSKIECSGEGQEFSVEFLTHQKAGAHWIPRDIKVSIEGEPPFEVDMGEAEINPPEAPDTNPPAGTKKSRLEIRNWACCSCSSRKPVSCAFFQCLPWRPAT